MTRVRNFVVTAMVVVGVAAIAAAANAQPGGQPGGPPGGGRGGFGFGFGGPGGFGGFGGGSLADVLRREDVRKELELLEDQVEKLQKLAEARGGQMRDVLAGLQDLSEEERREKIRERMEKAQAETEKQIGEVLLPHQMKRLKQLAVQMRLRFGARAMLEGSVAEQLGLTEDQKEKLRAKSEQLEEALRKKMAELRQQAQDELVKTLTPDQQAKFKEMVGDGFAFVDQPPQFGGPGGPQVGGQRRGDGQRGGGDRPRRPN
jgi:Spy/CpxP family protein refolding chaperone